MREDRRNRKTTSAIKQEVLKEMLVKKYNELTVSDICDSLDVSRRTFYLHFRDIEDVFLQLFDDINQPLYEGLQELDLKGSEDKTADVLDGIFRLINDVIASNTAYLARLAAEPSYSHIQMKHITLMKNLINAHLTVTGIDRRIQSIYLDYYLSGILELYFRWYRHEQDMTLDDIRRFALGIMKTDRMHFLDSFADSLSKA